MNASSAMVSIVTPVYNGEAYLKECIESVLTQSYPYWEYLIVNNCSTDGTLGLAKQYAERDERIRVHHYEEFVGVIDSYDRALGLISPKSIYCKVIAADDWMYPECLARMVELADANPRVGIVNAYTLSGGGGHFQVKFDGLSYKDSVMSGHEACRRHLLGGRHFLGTPTSVLYRADLVRARKPFFPNEREHADISVFYECLRDTDLGFIHQVLTYERIHGSALSTEAGRLSTYVGSQLLDLQRYGPWYLTPDELTRRIDQLLDSYYEILATAMLHRYGDRFWNYHEAILAEFGAPLSKPRLAYFFCRKLIDLLLNPKTTFGKLRKSDVAKNPPVSGVESAKSPN